MLTYNLAMKNNSDCDTRIRSECHAVKNNIMAQDSERVAWIYLYLIYITFVLYSDLLYLMPLSIYVTNRDGLVFLLYIPCIDEENCDFCCLVLYFVIKI